MTQSRNSHRHTVCINNNLIYLFGGADLEQRTNELYSFDPCKSVVLSDFFCNLIPFNISPVFFHRIFSHQQLEADKCFEHLASE